ncbi:MAG TPA: hypothetical protein VM008_20300 [Phycisphaerae bacterium]|nr:hypothetical protein [Phycisphaerae bacterium]
MFRRFLEFLFSLDHVRLTPNTYFSFVWNYPAWIVLGCLVLGGLGYFSYVRQAAAPRKRVAMGIVRAVLLAFVFMLIWRPELVVQHEERTRSVVAVWVDGSASMQLEDPYTDPAMRDFVKQIGAREKLAAGQTRLNRYQTAVGALEEAKWIREFAQSQDVALYTGSGHAQLIGVAHRPEEVAGLVEQLQKIKPEGETTDVPTVVQEILQNTQGQRVSAVVLATDGQTTEQGGGGRLDHAIAAAEQSGAKVFALPLGLAKEPFDLKLADMQVAENTFVRDPVAVHMQLSGSGIARPTPVRITLSRKGSTDGEMTELASREVTLDPDKKQMDVELIFKPQKRSDEKAERFDLVARVQPLMNDGDELTKANNVVTGQTNVLDAEVNVLYVEGYPRWEFRYLKNEMIREKTVNVATLLLSADEDFAQDGDPRVVDKNGHETFPGPINRFPETAEELAKFDVLYIGDVDPTFFSPSQQKLIVDFVGNGGGIGWIAGPEWNPEGYKGTALEVLMPIVPDDLDARSRVMVASDNSPFNPVPTSAGMQSNLFRFFDDPEQNAKQMAELPQMYWYKPVVGLAPAAEVLAVHPTRTQGGNPAPLLVTGHYKRGRTMFSAIDDTWRWRRYSGEPLYQSYWLQMCRMLYRNKALGQSKRIELTSEMNRMEVGRPLRVTMEVKDPTLLDQIPANVPAILTDRDGNAVESISLQRAASASEDGTQWTGVTTATEVGDFKLKIQPGVLPAVEGSTTEYAVTVEPPQREFEKLTADMESLGMLASKTTGAVVPIVNMEGLPKMIPDRSVPVLVSSTEELWYKPITLLLVVGLATLEWLLRKSAGLV